MTPFGLAIHGGAGAILRGEMSAEAEGAFRSVLQRALDSGYAVLGSDGSALQAVVAAIKILEDSGLFNAAHGAVLNADGLCELDASIMDGRNQTAGAVAGVQHVKNPIELARDVMLKSAHVMLAGKGAERFAQDLGYELVPNDYFQTPWRRQQLEKAQELEKIRDSHKDARYLRERLSFVTVDDNDGMRDRKWGTVGCVALDAHSNLAAGTSTGGMTNKKFGRVGDSPIIGAGTYANNATCALSATGHGEYFIRAVVAHDVSARMEYKGLPLDRAAVEVLDKVNRLGGSGGLIAIDAKGNVTLPFNTPGMYRGFRLSDGRNQVALFDSET